MKTTPQDASDIVYDDHPDFETIEDKIIDTTRWDIVSTIVILEKATGKFFTVDYRTGATECQDTRPFDDMSEVDWQEVKPVEKMITVYEKV